MAVSNGVIIVAAVIVVAAVGAETYMSQQVKDLRQTVTELSTRTTNAEAAATTAGTTAKQAAAKADQADATAAQAKEAADQARALATTAKETVDRLTVATAAPASAQPAARAATTSDIATGRDLALQICSACHVVSADQHFAPTLRPPASDFHSIANRPATTDRTLHDFLLTPHGKMPDAMLVDYQVTALVNYILSLRDQH